MANVGNVVRLIAIKGTHEGLDELTGKLKEVAAGHAGVAMETEKASRGSISVERAWKRATATLDETARAQDKMAIATKNANAAMAQGLTDQAGVTRHLGLMAVQYGLVSEAANRLTAGMSGLKVAAQAAASAVGKPLDALAAGMAKAGNFDAFASERMVAGLTKAGDAGTVAAQRLIAGMSGIKTAAVEAGASKPFDPLITGMAAAGDVSAVASQKIIAGMSGVKAAAEAAAAAANKPLSQLMAGMTAAGDVSAVASHKIIAGMSGVKAAAEAAAAAANKPLSQLMAGMTAAGDVSAVASHKIIAGMSGVKAAAEAAAAAANKPLSQMMAGMTAAGDASAVASHKMISGMSAMGKEAATVAPQIDKVTTSQAALTKQASRNAAEMLNLGRQAADVAVSLQAGQSILVVTLQQGAQIIDVIASSQRSMGQIASSALGWAKNFATSTVGVVTGIGAIAVGALYMASSWQEGQREIDKALIGIGKRAGATREDINKLAEASASSSQLSVSQSRTAALEFVKTGNIYSENLAGLVGLVKGHSVTIGESAEEAAKQLAKIFGDENIGAVADNLSKMYTGISGATRQLAVDLDVAGKRQQALAVLVNAITPSIKEAADATGFWAKRWDELSKAVSGFGTNVGKAISNIAPATEPQEQLEKKRGQLTVAEPALAQMREDAALMGRNLVPGLEQAEESVRSLQEAIVMLENQIISLKNAPEKARLEKLGNDADAVVRAFVPFNEQLDVAEKALNKLKEARDAMAAGKNIDMGQAKFLQQSIDAGEVRVANLNSEIEAAGRLNAYKSDLLFIEEQIHGKNASKNIQFLMQEDALKRQLSVAGAVGQMAQIEAQHRARIAELSITMNMNEAKRIANLERAVSLAQIEAQHQQTMVALQGQLNVAQQVTGIGQINAQYEATVANLTLQIGLERAIEQATLQRATAIAQVNTQAQQTLYTLQQESELIRANTEEERERIQARHTYNDLVRKGVDSELARAVASKQLRNTEERREQQQRIAEERAIANIRTRADAWEAFARKQISWSVANDEAGKANVRNQQAAADAIRHQEAAAANTRNEMTRMYQEATRFTGLLTSWHHMWSSIAESVSDIFSNLQEGKDIWTTKGGISQFNPAGYTSTVPGSGIMAQWATMLEPAKIDEALAKRFEQLVGSALSTGGVEGALQAALGQGDFGKHDWATSTVQSLTNLLPDDKKIGSLQQQIGLLQQQPATMKNMELMKQLNDQLSSLTKATEDNTSATDAQTDVLSPFYSSDPRKTHLGFRAFAGGGIMTPYGELPLKHYAGGGMATSPQVAVFGEGSTPEAYVPVPAGRIPVEVRTPANTNQKQQRPVTVNILVQGNADSGTISALKQTAFQQAQAMRRIAG